MRTLILAASLLSLPAVASATPVKVGVIDFDKLFTQTERAKVDRAELDVLLSTKQKEIDTRKQKLTDARAELASAGPRMDAVARARREAELDAEAAALKQMFAEAQTAVSTRERELSGKVVDEAKSVAAGVAEKQGISVVLGAAEALMWAAPSVVKVDLTSEIAQALDRRMAAKIH